ncbi:DUF5686 family protein [Bacteroidota bacterium]
MRVISVILITSLILCHNYSLAQKTIIKGRVVDATTNEPVAFANVYLKGTQTGTITNFEGYYRITTSTPSDTLVVSFIGYETNEEAIEKDKDQIVDFQVLPESFELSEVTIVPGENPAHRIMRKVWENKKKHNYIKCTSLQYESYSKVQLYLRKFTDKPNEEVKIKLFQNIFNDYAISTSEDGIPALPVYMSEAISDVYIINFPKREKVVVKASKISGVAYSETDMVQQLTRKHQQYNFYNNWLLIMDRNFISPIASAGLFYYKYYLVDSLFIDGNYCYEIRVKPRRSEDLTFNGTIWIHDTTFAMKRISVEVGKEANLNFIQRIKIQQDLETTDNFCVPVKTRILADAVNAFIRSYVVNTNIVLNQPKKLSFYSKEIIIADSARDSKEEYWENNRAENLSEFDITTYRLIDSLNQIPKIKFTAKLLETLIEGYYNHGKIEFGPYIMLYSSNNVEGHRFQLGFRTNSEFSLKWIIDGFAAYGTKDGKFKYNAKIERFLSREKWTKIGIQYREDVENVGAFDEFYSNSTYLTYASSFGGLNKINQIKVARLWLESDLFRGFSQKIVFTNKTMKPISKDYYFEYYSDDYKVNPKSNLRISEISFATIYQPKSAFIVDGNRRFPVSFHKAPTWILTYTLGIDNFLNSDFSYNKVSLGVSHRFNFGGLGFLKYDILVTKVFDPLPYPLLIFYSGNEKWIRTDRTYNLMNYGEFVADQALEIFYSYHFDGFIMNKFPLLKKLDWRLLTTGHIAYGSFDEEKNGYYDPVSNENGILPEKDINGNELTSFNTISISKPYVELSYGVENIFKVFRVDAIQRLSYLDNDNVSKFGVKLSATFRF